MHPDRPARLAHGLVSTRPLGRARPCRSPAQRRTRPASSGGRRPIPACRCRRCRSRFALLLSCRPAAACRREPGCRRGIPGRAPSGILPPGHVCLAATGTSCHPIASPHGADPAGFGPGGSTRTSQRRSASGWLGARSDAQMGATDARRIAAPRHGRKRAAPFSGRPRPARRVARPWALPHRCERAPAALSTSPCDGAFRSTHGGAKPEATPRGRTRGPPSTTHDAESPRLRSPPPASRRR